METRWLQEWAKFTNECCITLLFLAVDAEEYRFRCEYADSCTDMTLLDMALQLECSAQAKKAPACVMRPVLPVVALHKWAGVVEKQLRLAVCQRFLVGALTDPPLVLLTQLPAELHALRVKLMRTNRPRNVGYVLQPCRRVECMAALELHLHMKKQCQAGYRASHCDA